VVLPHDLPPEYDLTALRFAVGEYFHSAVREHLPDGDLLGHPRTVCVPIEATFDDGRGFWLLTGWYAQA
jgi:hypothetical protein